MLNATEEPRCCGARRARHGFRHVRHIGVEHQHEVQCGSRRGMTVGSPERSKSLRKQTEFCVPALLHELTEGIGTPRKTSALQRLSTSFNQVVGAQQQCSPNCKCNRLGCFQVHGWSVRFAPLKQGSCLVELFPCYAEPYGFSARSGPPSNEERPPSWTPC